MSYIERYSITIFTPEVIFGDCSDWIDYEYDKQIKYNNIEDLINELKLYLFDPSYLIRYSF